MAPEIQTLLQILGAAVGAGSTCVYLGRRYGTLTTDVDHLKESLEELKTDVKALLYHKSTHRLEVVEEEAQPTPVRRRRTR